MEEEKLESSVKEKEIRDLERLAAKFEISIGIKDIQGNAVYGYIGNKREYLGSFAEYSRYKTLHHKYKNHFKKSEDQQRK